VGRRSGPRGQRIGQRSPRRHPQTTPRYGRSGFCQSPGAERGNCSTCGDVCSPGGRSASSFVDVRQLRRQDAHRRGARRTTPRTRRTVAGAPRAVAEALGAGVARRPIRRPACARRQAAVVTD
jgi:hypothetical protein